MKELSETLIIESLLWTDLYKLTMGQVVWESFPEVEARYEFINRGKTKFPAGFAERLRDQVQLMAQVGLSTQEFAYLQTTCPYFSVGYLDWFRDYRFNPDEVAIEQRADDLVIQIEGPWARTIYWEVPLMTTISQLYFESTGQIPSRGYVRVAREKGSLLRAHGVRFLEFGTRRTFSTKVHREVLSALVDTAGRISEGGVLLGTSNVALAREFSLTPSGTYAHELVMAMAALFGVKEANGKAMEIWAKKYLGLDGNEAYPKLGTALTDTYTTDVFFRSFNRHFANYFTNLRQDSGDPFAIGEKIVASLGRIGVDPKTKGIVFSDGLDVSKAVDLNEHFAKKTNPLFGIGTDLTNDVGVTPLNMVIKLFGVRHQGFEWVPTIKLSDDLGKVSGDPETLRKITADLELLTQMAAHTSFFDTRLYERRKT